MFFSYIFTKPKITNKMNKPSKPSLYNAVINKSYLPSSVEYIQPDNIMGLYKKKDKK